MTTSTTVTYRGHEYRLVWSGQTKFGQRAKLTFLDGSKEFWVDASAIGQASAAQSTTRPTSTTRFFGKAETRRCWECGMAFTRASMGRDGEWGDSYCGC